MTIEGVGNIYSLHNFLCKEKIKNLEYDKIENEFVARRPCAKPDKSASEIYKDICSFMEPFLGKNVKISAPILPQPTIEKTETSAVPFDLTIKEPTPIKETIRTDYEKEKFNKLIYGGKKLGINEEAEKMEDLENIEALRDELNKLEISTARIPHVNENSSTEDIRNVRKLLIYKKNVCIHFNTVKDIFMVGINQIVKFCDGKGNRPNLTGWDRTAQGRLNALKTELSSLAGDFFRNYNIGPLTQILISLVPSALIHMGMNSKRDTAYTNNQKAISDLEEL